MSIGQSPFYNRSSSREGGCRTTRETLVQQSLAMTIKSARGGVSRDRISTIQQPPQPQQRRLSTKSINNRSINDTKRKVEDELNRSRRFRGEQSKNCSFNNGEHNRSISNDTTNLLTSYIAQAFNHSDRRQITRPGSKIQQHTEEAENFKLQELHQNRQQNDDFKLREMKYLMRIAALEKENQKATEQIVKYKKENAVMRNQKVELKDRGELELQIRNLQTSLNAQKAENIMLKKYVSQVSHTSKRSDASGLKNISTRANTVNSMSSLSAQKAKIDVVPSYMVALNLIES